jgi:hypothetical protein
LRFLNRNDRVFAETDIKIRMWYLEYENTLDTGVDGKTYFERTKLLVWAQDSSSRHRDYHDLSTQ